MVLMNTGSLDDDKVLLNSGLAGEIYLLSWVRLLSVTSRFFQLQAQSINHRTFNNQHPHPTQKIQAHHKCPE